jgi:hypothetical protein
MIARNWPAPKTNMYKGTFPITGLQSDLEMGYDVIS